MTGPTLRISRRQLLANIQRVRATIAPSELMIVMKDDAYGHGLEWVADAATSVDVGWFGSFDIRTGIGIRRALGERGRIFAWVTSRADEVADAIAHDIDLGVGTEEYLRLVIATAERLAQTARIHLKIDTGLHRNGIRPEDWPEAVHIARQAELRGSVRIVGVWSHLAEASDLEDDDSHRVFLHAVEQLSATGAPPQHVHLTASAASWWRPELRGSLARIGAFCYGIRSAEGPELDGVRPIAALSAPVIAVLNDEVEIAVGAFDGVPSTLRGATVGTPGGPRELRAVGDTSSRVAAWTGARTGDEVWIFGPGAHGELSATTLAERLDTVGEEIITRLTQRVRRVIED